MKEDKLTNSPKMSYSVPLTCSLMYSVNDNLQTKGNNSAWREALQVTIATARPSGCLHCSN